ncbi:MAG: iron-sulfur cluster assembly scaffold protein [Acidimicrobiales bacterium]|nr:iron-sulfur cluster assembly scaffold protein [Hyphomonadaceae bacterium]RZV44130.1 MAG: iron-sulfur cluster assembly scaffold protein [Acidimicrobiales bacterium]
MIDDLYNTDVLSLAASIAHVGTLEEPDASVRKVSKLCGSWVEVDVKADGDIVTGFAIRLQACALGQASAAILAERVIGASLAELKTARDALKAMLKSGGAPPTGKFSKLALLQEVANYPARHVSTLLAFNAVVEALESL